MGEEKTLFRAERSILKVELRRRYMNSIGDLRDFGF